MDQPDKELWSTMTTVTIVLFLIAIITAVVKAIVTAWRRSLDWIAGKVGESLRKEIK